MTAQFTQTGIILPSNLTTDVVVSKSDTSYGTADKNAFSSALDNASKSYADKNTNKVENVKDNKNYAQHTKDLKESNSKNEIRDNKNTDKVSNRKNDNKINDKNNIKDSLENNKTTDDKKCDDRIIDKNTDAVSSDETETSVEAEESVETKIEETAGLIQLGESALKKVEELLQNIQNNAGDVSEMSVENKTDISGLPEKETITDAKYTGKVPSEKNINNVETIANEQILANVEYSAETSDLNLEKIKNMTQQELKALVENIQKDAQSIKSEQVQQTQPVVPETDIQNESQNQSQIQNPALEKITREASADKQTKQIQSELKSTANTDEKYISIKSESNSIDYKLPENAKTSQQQAVLKTVQENMAFDTSRLTANIEQVQETADVKVVTPADTKPDTKIDIKSDNTPVIKVTEEVASQVKENAFNVIENKDNTSKIKDKAVQTMTALQDTDTTVTGTKTANSGTNSDSGNNSNNLMNQGNTNAAETAAKLSVDQGAVNFSQSNTAEAFVNKLDAQLSAMQNSSHQAKTLNQTDIMSQVTAKFEQLQQHGSNKVSIVLQPENLGKVAVEIMNSKDGLVAKMTTDTQQVKELFDKNVEALKSNLSSQGVNVNSIKIECAQESSNHGMEFERDQFNEAFRNGQNGQNHTNHSHQNTQTAYNTDYGISQTEEIESENETELKNTESVIKHNGKVDYKV